MRNWLADRHVENHVKDYQEAEMEDKWRRENGNRAHMSEEDQQDQEVIWNDLTRQIFQHEHVMDQMEASI